MARRSRLRAAAPAAVAALAAGLAAATTAAAAEPATFRLLGSSPTYGTAVDVQRSAGGISRVRPARYHYRVTTGAGASEASGFCVDLSHYIVTGRDYDVELQTAADAPELASPAGREAGWLVSRSSDLIAAAADARLEAAALQVAVWQLTGQAADMGAPTSDATLNARAAQLRALATGRRLPDALGVDVAGEETCAGAGAAVTVTGAPGTVVDLAVEGAGASVTPARVTLDALGTAVAEVRSGEAGTVSVTATTGTAEAVRATKLPGAAGPQDQLFVRPATLTAEDDHAFRACDLFTLAPSLPEPPPPAGPPPAPAAPAEALALSLAGPAVAAPGGTAVYRLTVRNRGRSVVRGVRVTQRLGAGLAPVRARGPRGATARVGRRAAAWRVAAIRPGRAVSLSLRVRVGRRVAGDLGRTTAVARTGAARASAGAATAVVRRVGKTEQGF